MSRSAALLRPPARETAPAISSPPAQTPVIQRSCATCGEGRESERKCPACGEVEALAAVQPKLVIGASDDPLEKEADEVADRVMRMPTDLAPAAIGISEGARPAQCQTFPPDHLRKATDLPAERQRRDATAALDSGAPAPQLVRQVLSRGGEPLDGGARQFFERYFARDLGNVRVHADSEAAASARAVNAHAYTVGNHLVFGTTRYAPNSRAGRHLLAHELTHVAQQGTGLRRLSKSFPPIGEGHRSEDDESPVQRLQRRPDTAKPDQPELAGKPGGKEEAAAATGAATAATATAATADCNPPSPPGWDSFKGSIPGGTSWSAWTSTRIGPVGVAGKQRFQASFESGQSWVKSRIRNAADPAKNGSADDIAKCKASFAGGRTGYWALGTVTGCAASPNYRGDKATSEAECTTIVGKDYTDQAVAESLRLLNHEQSHFRLTCALAKKANAALGAKTVHQIAAVTYPKLTALQARYDQETSHGCEAEPQATWDADIASGLPAVKLFK